MDKIEIHLNKPGKRFADALDIQAGACNPIAISRALVRAIEEVRNKGTDDICQDPAVRAIVHQLAHLTNVYSIFAKHEEYEHVINECQLGKDEADKPPVYEYFINLDERGEFRADVRDPAGKTVYEIQCPGVDETDTTIFDDGFMDHKNDIEGLRNYLKDIAVLPANAHLVKGN